LQVGRQSRIILPKVTMQLAVDIFNETITAHLTVIEALRQEAAVFQRIAARMGEAVVSGKKVVWCGNGGSAADSQHLAAELVGRFAKERRALPSIALSTNTSIVTAIGNDYGYDFVFRRQVEAMCVPDDVVVGISTSGNSRNVVLALEAARELGAFTVAFTGQSGGTMAKIAHESLRLPSSETPRIQEGHILCGHMLCDYVERLVYISGSATAGAKRA
jgi:D-sedoheptulose 7-phosphate isomerase